MNVHCILQKDSVLVFQGKDKLATVVEQNGEPTIVFEPWIGVELSFNDLAIIQDNWYAMNENRKNIDNL